MKGILLCAGRGTRMQPFTFTLPKTLLPVLNIPLLYHGINLLKEIDIKEIGIVIHPSQTEIINYLDSLSLLDLDIQVFEQLEQKGIAHALQSVQDFVGQDPFTLLLADNLITEGLSKLVDSTKNGKSSVLLKKVPNPQEFGVALIENGQISQLEEKPSIPRSDMAVMGAYVFQPSIFEAIHKIQPSGRGEYEITDAIQWLIDHGNEVAYIETTQPLFDVGTHDRWLEANSWMLSKYNKGKVKIGNNTRIENCVFIGDVSIGEDCVLENAVIGPFVSIQNCCVLRNCTIENSILMEKAHVNTHNKVINSIFGQESVLNDAGKNAIITCRLGDKSTYIPFIQSENK
ncbi:sugar phosphate nucleotidyltransferase [Niallia sp. 03133]|uniref:sugar phosphate nucleotidyltransferase n=1 Tax=Niallia sp. 03133 TaxID=3458060 RepID=UPI004044CC8F